MAGLFPKIAVDALEQRRGVRVPRPEEVLGERTERFQSGRKNGLYVHGARGAKSHAVQCTLPCVPASLRTRGRARGGGAEESLTRAGTRELNLLLGLGLRVCAMSGTVATMPFRAVLFDIGDTLWHSLAAPPAEAFRRMAAERAAFELRALGLSHPDPALVSRSVWLAMEDAMRRDRKAHV